MSGAGSYPWGIGTGGLLKRSTWLRPVPTFGDLPVPAPPGAAAFVLSPFPPTPYQFDGFIWTPFGAGGGVPIATSAPGGGIIGKWTADEDKGLKIVTGIGEVKVDGVSVFFDGFGRLASTGSSADFDKIVTAQHTDVFNTEGAEVPMVVIARDGNVVARI